MPRVPVSRDRKRQQRRAQSERRRKRRELELEAALKAADADFELLLDPDVPVEAAAAAFGRLFELGPAGLGATRGLMAELGGERARALAAPLTREGARPSALALAADVAWQLDRDAALARAHLGRARELGDLPEIRARLALIDAEEGQLVRAASAMDDYLAAHPDDFFAGAERGLWLARLEALGAEPEALCPCGSGETYGDCCRAGGDRLLARFADRNPTYELRESVNDYAMGSPELVRFLARSAEEWLRAGALAREDIASSARGGGVLEAPLMRLVLERAWLQPLGAGRETTILRCFADDPTTPAGLARRARDWEQHVRWGLWEVTELKPPGTVLTNYLSGGRIFTEIAPEQRQGLRRWSVLLGYLIPVEGVWRSGGAFIVASPAEADSVARSLLTSVLDGAGRRTPQDQVIETWAGRVLAQIEEGSWIPEEASGPTPVEAIASALTEALLPALVSQLLRQRAIPPAFRNTDEDPIELIEARLRLAEPGPARLALLAHPDIEEEEGGDLNWLGRRVSGAEQAQMQAQMRGQGLEPDPDASPGRYSRGSLKFRADELWVSVNSRARLERLLALLVRLGHPAVVLSETSSDPSQALGQEQLWAAPGDAGPAPGPDRPEMARAWLGSLLDEPVPALDRLTPRQAAQRPEYRARLEVFVRTIEYQAAGRGAEDDAARFRESLARG